MSALSVGTKRSEDRVIPDSRLAELPEAIAGVYQQARALQDALLQEIVKTKNDTALRLYESLVSCMSIVNNVDLHNEEISPSTATDSTLAQLRALHFLLYSQYGPYGELSRMRKAFEGLPEFTTVAQTVEKLNVTARSHAVAVFLKVFLKHTPDKYKGED